MSDKNCNATIILNIFFIFLFCGYSLSAQQGHSDAQYFLIRKDAGNISINTYSDGRITEHAVYPAEGDAVYCTDGLYYTAVYDRQENLLNVYSLKKGNIIKEKVPFDGEFKALLVYGGEVFMGGRHKGGGALLVQMNIESRKWVKAVTPSDLSFIAWKEIDDLLIDGNTLLAVDNIVTPKYILYFNLNEDNKAEYSHFGELASRTYESIKFGRINEKYIGILSTSTHRAGSSNFITIYKKNDISRRFALEGTLSSYRSDIADIEYNKFNDFIIFDNKVILASEEKGIGLVNINEDYFSRSGAVKADYRRYKIREKETAILLSLIPGACRAVVTMSDNDGGLRHEIIELGAKD